jgi:hypothetical protein
MNLHSYAHLIFDKAPKTRIYRELVHKINEPIKKWASELNRIFSKEEFKWPKNT